MSRIRWGLRRNTSEAKDVTHSVIEKDWNDNPIERIEEDNFDFQDYAQWLADRGKLAKPPLTIGIFGSWGSGKTSLMKLAELQLPKQPSSDGQIFSIWINAWQLSGQDEVGDAFLQALFSKVQKSLGLWSRIDKRKLLRQVLTNSYRVVLVITPMIVGILIAKPEAGWEDLASLLRTPIAGLGTLLSVGLGLWALVKPIIESARATVNFDLKATLKYVPYEAQVTELMKLRTQFQDMVRALVGESGRLVVFIDDLDRCSPSNIVEVLEAIKLFATADRCVYILGLDHEIIQQAIKKKYSFDEESEAKEYLEKIVQIQFLLPRLTGNQILLFIKQVFPEIKEDCEDCPQIFAAGLLPNPRKVKLALNSYRSGLQIAHSRWKNFEMDYQVDRELFAKMVVIQNRFPDLYEVLILYPDVLKLLETWILRQQNSLPRDSGNGERASIGLGELLNWIGRQLRDSAGVENIKEDSIFDSYPPEIVSQLLGWLMKQSPAQDKKEQVIEKSKLLDQLELGDFGLDPSLDRVLRSGNSRFADLGSDELGAYIFLVHQDERMAGQIYPTREERKMLLGGNEKEIRSRLEEDILKRGLRWEDRQRNKKAYEDFLNSVIESETSRGNPAMRLSANMALDILKERERKEFEPMTVRIPSGRFLMGSGEAEAIAFMKELDDEFYLEIAEDLMKDYKHPEELPQHEVALFPYRISRFPITNVEYEAFVEAANHDPPEHWKGGKIPRGESNHPVMNVTWEDANAYCHWLSEETNKPYRLPTEAEWEKAARGTDGRIYPWGNEWDPTRLNSVEGGVGHTTAVGQYSPEGDSIYGVADMLGNVWEWCEDQYDPKAYVVRSGKIVRDPVGGGETERRVQRGGSFNSSKELTRCSCRGGGTDEIRLRVLEYQLDLIRNRNIDWGFRVVISHRDAFIRAMAD